MSRHPLPRPRRQHRPDQPTPASRRWMPDPPARDIPGDDAALAVADRFADAFVHGDSAALEVLYAPDLCFVSHIDGSEPRDREAALTAFAAIRPQLGDVSLETVERSRTDRGYVAQQVIRCALPDGTLLTVAACLVVRVERGRITRIDEYLDSRAVAPLLARIGPAATQEDPTGHAAGRGRPCVRSGVPEPPGAEPAPLSVPELVVRGSTAPPG